MGVGCSVNVVTETPIIGKFPNVRRLFEGLGKNRERCPMLGPKYWNQNVRVQEAKIYGSHLGLEMAAAVVIHGVPAPSVYRSHFLSLLDISLKIPKVHAKPVWSRASVAQRQSVRLGPRGPGFEIRLDQLVFPQAGKLIGTAGWPSSLKMLIRRSPHHCSPI